MKETQNTQPNNQKDNSLMHIALITGGMLLIAFAALYFPILIFALLFIAPIALKYDMDSNTPVLSIGMIAVSALFILFSWVQFSLYIILVIGTGFCPLIGYIIYRYIKVNKFSDGLAYSILLSVFTVIIAALIVFLMRDRQSFALEIVNGFESWALNNDLRAIDQNIDLMYNSMRLLNSAETETFGSMFEVFTGAADYGSELTKEQKLHAIMPYIQDSVNVYSIAAMLLYPAFAGIMTWWRGNYRLYKNKPVSEENKDMKPKPFSTFTVPRNLFGIMVGLLFLSLVLRMPGNSDVVIYAANVIQSFASILLAIQGFAVMEYFLKRNSVFKFAFVRVMLMIVVTLISIGFVPIFLGVIDLFINIRLVYNKTKEMKDKIEKMKMRDNHKTNDSKDNE